MKRKEISAVGIINKDGKLSMRMDELNRMFAENKGERVIATFHIVPTASSEAMKAYYHKYIVPTINRAAYEQGERQMLRDTDQWLREQCPVCWDESVDIDTGEYDGILKGVEELSNSELLEFIEFLRQFAAENYQVYIDEPNTI